MKKFKTEEDIRARIKDKVFFYEGDIMFKCDVDMEDVSFEIVGNFRAKNIKAANILVNQGDLKCFGNIDSNYNVRSQDGKIEAQGYIDATNSVTAQYDIIAGDYINAEENSIISTAGNIKAKKDVFYGDMIAALHGRITARRILNHGYWEELPTST
jgi:hypothetical protein